MYDSISVDDPFCSDDSICVDDTIQVEDTGVGSAHAAPYHAAKRHKPVAAATLAAVVATVLSKFAVGEDGAISAFGHPVASAETVSHGKGTVSLVTLRRPVEPPPRRARSLPPEARRVRPPGNRW